MLRRVLRDLTDLPGVLAAAAYDDDAELLAFYGPAVALTRATACAELTANVAHGASAPIVPRVEFFDDAVAVAHPLHPGMVVLVAEPSFDPAKPIVWTSLATAARALARELEFAVDPASETLPNFARPPGF